MQSDAHSLVDPLVVRAEGGKDPWRTYGTEEESKMALRTGGRQQREEERMRFDFPSLLNIGRTHMVLDHIGEEADVLLGEVLTGDAELEEGVIVRGKDGLCG